jgi:GNAT superfamily N-acetyltransferase
MPEIIEAKSTAELNEVRQLIRAFVAWHREQHVHDIDRIDRYFDPAAFEAELAGLPGHYAPPSGALLLAHVDGEAAGCVAMHDLGEGNCEMKRMFVPVKFRGRGVGRGLAERVVEAGSKAGYRRMRLDTSRSQTEALRLYEWLGFRQVEPYYELPEDLRDWLVFYEKAL